MANIVLDSRDECNKCVSTQEELNSTKNRVIALELEVNLKNEEIETQKREYSQFVSNHQKESGEQTKEFNKLKEGLTQKIKEVEELSAQLKEAIRAKNVALEDLNKVINIRSVYFHIHYFTC